VAARCAANAAASVRRPIWYFSRQPCAVTDDDKNPNSPAVDRADPWREQRYSDDA
jgi:hypothetical protein